MQRKPLVYVSRITNLSDARYCAGMGVDLLGFVIDPADPDYVSPEVYQQLVGWISGPARVIQIGSAVHDLARLTQLYAPEFLHVDWHRLTEIPEGPVRLIAEVTAEDMNKSTPVIRIRKDVAHLLVTGSLAEHGPIPHDISILSGAYDGHGTVRDFLKYSGAAGVALRGSKEAIPGLKDYDHLSQVLEELNG
jgi:phosphoribosylanthranilate isomerase